MATRIEIEPLRWLYDRRFWAVGVAVALAVAVWEAEDTWWPGGSHWRSTVKLVLYWASWLLWPALVAFVLRAVFAPLRRRWRRGLVGVLGAVACSGLLYARFIEPHELVVRESSIDLGCRARIALVSDLHVGLFVRQDDLEALVTQLNLLDVDAVLVAGDWTYEPRRDLAAVFAPFSRMRHPVYGILGNHDEKMPGPDLEKPLREALSALKVQWIEGRRVPLGRCELVGLGDLSAGSAARDLQALRAGRSAVPAARRIVLTHNPDTLALYDTGFAALSFAGHTHGGQIDLPWLTDRLLRRMTDGDYRQGLYERPQGRIFVTPGVGMTRLPLRFRVPPTIDRIVL